jgi:hypothetical protein
MTRPYQFRSWGCACGSLLPRRELADARGIFCAYVCDECEAEKRAAFRSDIFTDPHYPTIEDIEDDDDGNAAMDTLQEVERNMLRLRDLLAKAEVSLAQLVAPPGAEQALEDVREAVRELAKAIPSEEEITSFTDAVVTQMHEDADDDED